MRIFFLNRVFLAYIFVFYLAAFISLGFADTQPIKNTKSTLVAQDTQFSVAGIFGAGIYSNNYGKNLSFGSTFLYQWSPFFSAGITALFTRLDHIESTSIASSVSSKSNLNYYNVVFNYYLLQVLNGLRAGAQLGIAHYSLDFEVSAGSASTSNSTHLVALAFGPTFGYDFNFAEKFALGSEINYLIANFDSISINSFNLLFSLKYHF